MEASMSPISCLLGSLMVLLSLWVAPPASATSAIYLTEVEQAAESTAVVVATIGSARVEVDPKWQRPITLTTIHVAEVLLGSAPEKLTIEQFGGTIAGKTLFIPGDARLKRGERCVLFLRQVDGNWFLTAMQQSKYEIHEAARQVLLRRTLSDGLFVRTDKGLEPLEEPPHKPVLTLRRLREELRRSFSEKGARR